MSKLQKLPAAEFEIMKVIWNNPTPISTTKIAECLDTRNWKLQTILTLLKRLMARGFISSDKVGKDRTYSPIVAEDEYLSFETGSFIETFHNNSVTGLMTALYNGKKISEDDLDALEKWMKER